MEKLKLEFKRRCKKTDVLKSCDCFIGFLQERRIHKSTFELGINNFLDMQLRLQKTNFRRGKELYTVKQIIDNRRGFIIKFTYCPFCGDKLNWKQLFNKCND